MHNYRPDKRFTHITHSYIYVVNDADPDKQCTLQINEQLIWVFIIRVSISNYFQISNYSYIYILMVDQTEPNITRAYMTNPNRNMD